MKKKGFTLIELMVVIAIIAILASIASVKVGEQLSKTRDGKAVSIIGSWRSANHLRYSDTSTYSTSFGALQDKVDNQTINLTYSSNTKVPFDGLSTQWTSAGLADGNSVKTMVSFTITGSSIESSVVFDDSNGRDTKGNLWNTY